MRGPYRKRLVQGPPRINQFKPAGVLAKSLPTITLTIDEFEGIRLADLQGLDHNEAAQKMAISRPTFSRLIEKARYKVAQALINGMVLSIEGGNFDFKQTTFHCPDCGDYTEQPLRTDLTACPDCGSENVIDLGRRHQNHGHRRHEK